MPLPSIRRPNEADLLRWFFENPRKPNYAFRLHKELGITWASVSRAIHDLCEDGWLVPAGTMPGRGNPRNQRKMYALSDAGQDQVAAALAEWDAWTKKAGVTIRYPQISGTDLPGIRGPVQADVLGWFSKNPGKQNHAVALGRGLDIRPGSAFKALQSLCKGGWLDDAGKELQDGRLRRMFVLSEAGKRHVDAALDEWDEAQLNLVRALEDAIDALLERRPSGTLEITVQPKDGGVRCRFDGYVIVPGPGDGEERLPSSGGRPAQGKERFARALKDAVAASLGDSLEVRPGRWNKDGTTTWNVDGVVDVPNPPES